MDRLYINVQNTRILPRFEYHDPPRLEEALELLGELEGARLLAGGTDLLVDMKQGLVEPRHLINVKYIEELNGIEDEGEGIHIGAATRLRAIERSKLIRAELPLLHEAVVSI
ncbi:MAG: FAD binding domain-containing protein, partial [Candidatus Bathyarchaeia archaeon]